MQLINKKEDQGEKHRTGISLSPTEQLSIEQNIAASITKHPTSQLILSSRFITHQKEAGLNSLVDSAAKLFSIIGKLKHIKSHDNLANLHQELVEDIQLFQKNVETTGTYQSAYLTEYLPLATYTLCVTLDDLITTLPWGNQGKWDEYRLLAAFNQERLSSENFLIILERLIRDPNVYIDLMEFMYICLSLGFKCHFSSSEGDTAQLQQITYSLYRRIRTYRGNFSKILTPFPIKSRTTLPATFSWKHVPIWLMGLFFCAGLVLCFIIGQNLLDWTFHRAANTLTQMERTLNEKHHE
jgi:type IV/VI secretion system ImpK/VasF family protein